MSDPLERLHPAVRHWFRRTFPDGPTEAQREGWPAIAAGEHTLIAAPTGSGKTLAAFLVCIDRLIRTGEAAGALPDETRVVYVSPLKALAADIHHNLERPLAGIRESAAALGLELPPIRTGMRTGDTSPAERAALVRRPPHLLVTTPESLYLLLTAGRSRAALRHVDTVIVDEIHAVARDKRGSHLALTLERLAAAAERPPVRIGLSATQRPVETVARLLVGAGPERERADGSPACTVVDRGHRRALDLALELPDDELGAAATHEQMAAVMDRIAELVEGHRTTLVFTNTRRLAERLAHGLAERLGPDRVAAHHGSLSKERRARLEARLRAGDLRALVATASLELGIDVGPVELVCQIGSPRSLATFLQRVGRSGHALRATPRGRLFPTTRDELVECAALLRGVAAGRLDRLRPPEAPLDVLAQQIVAECAAQPWSEAELFDLVRRAAPYASLAREDFDAVVGMLSEGIRTGHGRRGAHLHRDRVNGMLRARRGARLAALTSGGAIPETADYRVVAEPGDTFVGTVNEDFAVESMAGDVFLLGSTSWRVRRVESGTVRVVDAEGAPPTIPFWLGEAPARTEELSEEVSSLRAEVARRLERGGVEAARAWLREEAGLGEDAADTLARYLDAGRAALGVVPTREDVVFERFFDETGGMQLVVHAPYGGRVNRGLGLALRKRFCRSFDFELQAAANDDAIVLSLGPQHAFPLDAVPRFLHSERVADVLAQALLASPMFAVRWRWNLGRALVVLRQRGGRRVPPPLQRMQADDLLAALFPSLAACQENVTGPIEIPDHPLVRETLRDCLYEAADLPGLEALLRGMEEGRVRVHLRDTTEPSPLCHEILNGRPFTFLDDAPLEERRTRAVAVRRGLPEQARDLGRLDPEAIARVREEARPAPRDAEELHDLLLSTLVLRPEPAWEERFAELVRAGRAAWLEGAHGRLWVAAEGLAAARVLLPGARVRPPLEPLGDGTGGAAAADPDAVAAEALRGHLDGLGPTTAGALAERTGLGRSRVEAALARLESEGFALRGRFDEALAATDPAEQWCARRLLARIHLYTRERLRREIEPVSARDFVRFAVRWQSAAPDTRREGRRGLLAVVEQLAGFELPAAAWEADVLPARVAGYRAEWLDALCMTGEVAWARLSVREPDDGTPDAGRGGAAPSAATPITFVPRASLPVMLALARDGAAPREPGPGAARDVLDALRSRGALFASDLAAATGRLPVEIEEGLWDGVARGLVSADGFEAVRTLLGARTRRARAARRRRAGRPVRAPSLGAGGRFALLPAAAAGLDREELAEHGARQLLARWGVVFRELLARESVAVPWRELLRALRRLEDRGLVRGGRFVAGLVGEQFALPGAVEALRAVRRRPLNGSAVRVCAADPLNLAGIVLPGPRIPAVRTRAVEIRDGIVSEAPPAARPLGGMA